jgi:hypothetical protein
MLDEPPPPTFDEPPVPALDEPPPMPPTPAPPVDAPTPVGVPLGPVKPPALPSSSELLSIPCAHAHGVREKMTAEVEILMVVP